MIYALIAILAAALVLYAVVSAGAGGGKKRRGRTPQRHMASSRGSRSFVDPSEVRARWSTIMAVAGTGASGLKSSINEADKLFDHVLKELAVPGDTMGERLKSARSRFSDYSVYDAVWRAHKLRNSMAHDIGFDLVASQAKEALADFERGLKALGAL